MLLLDLVLGHPDLLAGPAALTDVVGGREHEAGEARRCGSSAERVAGRGAHHRCRAAPGPPTSGIIGLDRSTSTSSATTAQRMQHLGGLPAGVCGAEQPLDALRAGSACESLGLSELGGEVERRPGRGRPRRRPASRRTPSSSEREQRRATRPLARAGPMAWSTVGLAAVLRLVGHQRLQLGQLVAEQLGQQPAAKSAQRRPGAEVRRARDLALLAALLALLRCRPSRSSRRSSAAHPAPDSADIACVQQVDQPVDGVRQHREREPDEQQRERDLEREAHENALSCGATRVSRPRPMSARKSTAISGQRDLHRGGEEQAERRQQHVREAAPVGAGAERHGTSKVRSRPPMTIRWPPVTKSRTVASIWWNLPKTVVWSSSTAGRSPGRARSRRRRRSGCRPRRPRRSSR